MFCKLKKNRPDTTRDEIGIEGESWSRAVVSRALRLRGWHWQRVEMEREFDLESELKSGSFLVEGLLSPTYVRGTKTYRNNFIGVGNHSVAVAGGKVLDSAFAPNTPMGLAVLHLKGAVADPNIGFLRFIRRVYRCFKCVGGPGCKGTGGKCLF